MNEKEQEESESGQFLGFRNPIYDDRVLSGRTASLTFNRKLILIGIIGAIILIALFIRIDRYAVMTMLVLWAAILCCIKLIAEGEET